MKKQEPVKNMDTLEKEIFRSKLELKDRERRLVGNLDHFRDHFTSYVTGSFNCKHKEERKKSSFVDMIFNNEKVHSFVSGVAEKAAGKTGELLEKILDRFFKNSKH